MAMVKIFLSPDEGLMGIRFRRGYQTVSWKQLTYDERDKVISHLEKVLIVCRANKIDKK